MALNNTTTDELQKEFLLNIKKGGMRAKDLVQQILSFSRKKPEVCEPIYLKPIVREVIGFLRGTLPSSIKFTCNIQKETEPVMGNSSNIHEILMNLATNAQHAMDEKGHLAINLYEKVIEKPFSGAIAPVETGHYSIIEVIDDGAGISGDKISLIFDPFYTTKEVGKGTGLGLSVVFGLMQSCQGNIEVISKEGVGTTFKLYFPKTKQKIDEKDQKIPAENLKNGCGRILLVDDDETIVKMGYKMLTLLGYEVTAIEDSRQALKLLKNNIDAYDLLISDQTMPGLTGMELAIEVLKENPEFPILLCTGYSSKVDEKKALELGCRGFVHKPLTIDDLSKKIREILREKKLTK
jgi:CheY-like chemotaxis protein/two-component sensor histidine kinase